jgi:hypothetical protein
MSDALAAKRCFRFLTARPGKMMKRLPRLLLSLSLILSSANAFGFETDQFNLPPTPLVDIGDEVSDHVSQSIKDAAARLNAHIAEHSVCVGLSPERPGRCGSVAEEREILAYLRSDEAIAREVFKQLGDGVFPLSHIGGWLASHRFRGTPATFKTSYGDSIYILSPTNYITISPTVRLYGSEFGIDKIEHFFQQGYSYYRKYKRSLASGASAEEATRRAIKWGQMTERTYFGSLVSGVFSNADLYANFAGLKFYIALTQPVKIGESVRPPLLKMTNGAWALNSDAEISASVLRPFISDHLNEALNPSGFNLFLFASVKKVIRKHSCPEWREIHKSATAAELDTKSLQLRNWNGEDYGFTEKSRMIDIGQLCFADDK